LKLLLAAWLELHPVGFKRSLLLLLLIPPSSDHLSSCRASAAVLPEFRLLPALQTQVLKSPGAGQL
jgi:hypothetical protein